MIVTKIVKERCGVWPVVRHPLLVQKKTKKQKTQQPWLWFQYCRNPLGKHGGWPSCLNEMFRSDQLWQISLFLSVMINCVFSSLTPMGRSPVDLSTLSNRVQFPSFLPSSWPCHVQALRLLLSNKQSTPVAATFFPLISPITLKTSTCFYEFVWVYGFPSSDALNKIKCIIFWLEVKTDVFLYS